MALLIFALAAAVLGAAYVNVLNTYDVAARGTVVNEDFAFARQRVLTEPDRKKVEEGGEFDTVGGRHAHWTAEIASTGMPDLFEVNFFCEITDPQVREPEKSTEKFLLLRPTWGDDPAEQGKLREDVKNRILEIQGKQQK